jgi:tetraprenyl-beta-curcumene synthase
MWLTEKAYSIKLIIMFITRVFPLVDTQLEHWRRFAADNCSPLLGAQALSSIKNKKFHCQGGSIYALYPGVPVEHLTRFIVAYQTISDYLDNLCDRAGVTNEAAFRQLHTAMTDALDPAGELNDYYALFPYSEDGGYLISLVTTCRQELACLPSYQVIRSTVIDLARLYSELQTFKHLDPRIREDKMISWAKNYMPLYPELTPWEFAAACGSTLGIFMLCAAASQSNLNMKSTQVITNAYFPWICSLHILLDYLIDRNEDLVHGDLNFVSYYKDEHETLTRHMFFLQQALTKVQSLPHAAFHTTVISGLLAMYLSDPKTVALPKIRDRLLETAGLEAKFLYYTCRILRLRNIL